MAVRPRGFTLIEVLVVVILIAIIMATIVGAFTGADREQEFKGLVTRIAMRIEMARDRAIQSNTEWGVFVERDALRFASYDYVNQEWIERPERAFQQEASELELAYELDIEAYPTTILPSEDEGDDEDEVPDLWLFSSGEVMPFTLEIRPGAAEMEHWALNSDGISRTELIRGDN